MLKNAILPQKTHIIGRELMNFQSVSLVRPDAKNLRSMGGISRTGVSDEIPLLMGGLITAHTRAIPSLSDTFA